ncbi:polysaccharide lyase family 1 protein [Flavimarina sp. Hel_I_48]|uniref:pectate lyase family protein n=1 Tax=Flavimarina sp. Hel_I_48 TaxID=1392488 RepID=UPI0004DFB059|nr:hypothetical protein [Flavimarina sp. Hel_I_48]
MKISRIKYLFFLTILLSGYGIQAQQLAFPTAEGFGRYTTGGRGGQVCIVTNLNDSGDGSLRDCVLKHGPRTIVFAVSGTIELKSNLDINRGNLTIAGQSAPGDGICIKNYPMKVKADNVIIRYMRFRMGDVDRVEDDAFGGRDQQNIILDHCSISWATDENASFYWNKNYTMQWCIISEALNNSIHHKGAHGYGGIWGGENASFHHNLIASNKSRNPRFSGSQTTKNPQGEYVDFRNNVIYNWGNNSIYGGEKGTYNLVNNYFKPGPATSHSKSDRIVEPYKPYGNFFISGNYMKGSEKVTKNNWDGGVQCDQPLEAKMDTAFTIEGNVNTQDAKTAYKLVLANAGASRKRDSVDRRIVESVKTGEPKFGDGIIDSQNDVGGWPKLNSEPAPKDSDQDGMSDSWEKKKKLDVNSDDSAKNSLDRNYTNLEVYMNSLVENDLSGLCK